MLYYFGFIFPFTDCYENGVEWVRFGLVVIYKPLSWLVYIQNMIIQCYFERSNMSIHVFNHLYNMYFIRNLWYCSSTLQKPQTHQKSLFLAYWALYTLWWSENCLDIFLWVVPIILILVPALYIMEKCWNSIVVCVLFSLQNRIFRGYWTKNSAVSMLFSVWKILQLYKKWHNMTTCNPLYIRRCFV